MKLILCLCLIWVAAFNVSSAQSAATNFNKIVPLVHLQESVERVYVRLDSLKQVRSGSSISNVFDRDIDFGFNQVRIKLVLNDVFFAVDIIHNKNKICVYDIRALNYDGQTLSETHFKKVGIDSALINSYLESRNGFYKSHKDLKALLADIEYNESYAMYCGDASPETQEGKYIDKLVRGKNTKILINMLQSISCETQAYGITGFKMLLKQGYQLDNLTPKLIAHIEKRNSPVLTCQGCLDQLLTRLYGER